MSLFQKVFLSTFVFTIASWSAAWVCLAVAGESPSLAAKRLGSSLNQGAWADEKENLDFAGIEHLSVEAAAADVTVEKIVGDGSVSVEYSGIVKPGGKILRVRREGDTLKVSLDSEREHSVAFLFTDDDDDNDVKGRNHATAKGLRITVPADLAKSLRIETQSGDVKLKNLNAEEMQIKSVSGQISVKMPDATGWKFALATTSGEIENEFSDDSSANKTMQLRTTSGDIRVHR